MDFNDLYNDKARALKVWTECPTNSYVGALMLIKAVFGERAFEEVKLNEVLQVRS